MKTTLPLLATLLLPPPAALHAAQISQPAAAPINGYLNAGVGVYETWFGEHSYLTTRAGEIIERESIDILSCLKRAQQKP